MRMSAISNNTLTTPIIAATNSYQLLNTSTSTSNTQIPTEQDFKSTSTEETSLLSKFFKWFTQKVLPDSIVSFLTSVITYGIAHYVFATMSREAWIGKVPGFKGLHEKIVTINDVMRENMGESEYNTMVQIMRKPGDRDGVSRFWAEWEKFEKKGLLQKHGVSKRFAFGYHEFFKTYNRWINGIIVGLLSWARAAYFSPSSKTDEKPDPFSISALTAGIAPVFFAFFYWGMYERLAPRAENAKKNEYKLLFFQERPLLNEFKGEKAKGRSWQSIMDNFVESVKVTTKSLKLLERFGIKADNLMHGLVHNPSKTVLSSAMAGFLAYLSRSARRNGGPIPKTFQAIENSLNFFLPKNKQISFSKRLTEFKGFEETLSIPFMDREEITPEKQNNKLNPSYFSDGNEGEFVKVSAFKAMLKLGVDNIMAAVMTSMILSAMNSDDPDKKKSKQNSKNQNIQNQDLLKYLSNYSMGLTSKTATA